MRDDEGARGIYEQLLEELEEPQEGGSGWSLTGCILILLVGLAVTGVALVFAFMLLLSGNGSTPGATLVARCETAVNQTDSPVYNPSDPSSVAGDEIPEHYFEEYKKAAQEYGMDWAVLAAVGFTETRHGEGGKRNTCISSSVGAQGPMQFMPYTWPAFAVDADGDGEKDPCNFQDAIHTAANKLTSEGAPENYRKALYHYNASEAYINKVLAKAEEYRQNSPRADDSPERTTEEAAGEALDLVRLAATDEPANNTGSGNPPSGWSMVDSERQLDYDVSNSRYADVFEEAAAEWNALGGVQLQPSQSPSDTDVTVVDEHIPGFAVGYATSARGGIIKLEPSGMDGGDRAFRKTIAVHEIGHALGFPHSMETGEQSIMNYNNMYDYTSPTPYDVEVYRRAWGGSGTPSSPETPVSSGNGVPKECLQAGLTPTTPTENVSLDGGSTDDVAGKELGIPGGRPGHGFNEYNEGYQFHGGTHNGVDVHQEPGTPAYAWTDGEVVDSCTGCDPGGFWNYNVVRYDTPDGPYTVVLGHIMDSSVLPPGTSFKKGQEIAQIGTAKDGLGSPHIHFGAWEGDIGNIGSWENDVNPAQVFNAVAGEDSGDEQAAAERPVAGRRAVVGRGRPRPGGRSEAGTGFWEEGVLA